MYIVCFKACTQALSNEGQQIHIDSNGADMTAQRLIVCPDFIDLFCICCVSLDAACLIRVHLDSRNIWSNLAKHMQLCLNGNGCF